MKILYATDVDRTLIFSHRFIDEYKPNCEYTLVEKKGDTEISYMSNNVIERLQKLNDNEEVVIVPVTTRSIGEFNRINLGIKPRFAIVANGGIILENGEPIKEYESMITRDINKIEFLQASMDLSELKSIERECTYIDNKYIFTKTTDAKQFDEEIAPLMLVYNSLNFVRQRNKVYAIPKAFSKAIALRWLQHYTSSDTIVASGDSELDLPMLAIADYAIVPEHGDLVKEGYVTGGRIANAGIESPLYTIDTIEQLLEKNKA